MVLLRKTARGVKTAVPPLTTDEQVTIDPPPESVAEANEINSEQATVSLVLFDTLAAPLSGAVASIVGGVTSGAFMVVNDQE